MTLVEVEQLLDMMLTTFKNTHAKEVDWDNYTDKNDVYQEFINWIEDTVMDPFDYGEPA
ncbi:MAG: hypothetical protein ACXAEN_17510 [Candidatus Thorarchaeota archaeon]|jgi:hypothetical protein